MNEHDTHAGIDEWPAAPRWLIATAIVAAVVLVGLIISYLFSVSGATWAAIGGVLLWLLAEGTIGRFVP